MSSTDDLGPALLVRARNAIASVFLLPALDEPMHPALAKPGATFVTLRCGGKLRGCVGTLIAVRALDADVRHAAYSAAFTDPRFLPLRADEYPSLCIEVSVIGASTTLPAANEAEARVALRPFIDGVTLRWRGNGATLLPQVWKNLPQPEEFLAALKQKAGLPADFWADDIELSRYSVVHFDETTGVLQ
ncbi:MAG TPA: AmmeMemoRadiSam system protein A [Burkholderiaceae bacterium]|nr:AmmeMemoRadiSam system protein A [Burkholderiaceae bacterium]